MKYSDRLGEISDEQLQKALDKFSLGKLLKAELVNQGLFGQNLFLTSDKGDTKEDLDWVEQQFQQANDWLSVNFQPCFVMQDYKPGNMMVDKIDSSWQVTGLFDLMESYFGHGETDLARLFSVYVELCRKDLGQIFINSYREVKKGTEGLEERFPIFMIHDRAIIWEWVQRTNRVWWDKSLDFRQWVDSFLCLNRD